MALPKLEIKLGAANTRAKPNEQSPSSCLLAADGSATGPVQPRWALAASKNPQSKIKPVLTASVFCHRAPLQKSAGQRELAHKVAAVRRRQRELGRR